MRIQTSCRILFLLFLVFTVEVNAQSSQDRNSIWLITAYIAATLSSIDDSIDNNINPLMASPTTRSKAEVKKPDIRTTRSSARGKKNRATVFKHPSGQHGSGSGGHNNKKQTLCQFCKQAAATQTMGCCHLRVCHQCKKQNHDGCSNCQKCSLCMTTSQDVTSSPCRCAIKMCRPCFSNATKKTNLCTVCKTKVCEQPSDIDNSYECAHCGYWFDIDLFLDHEVEQHSVQYFPILK